MENNAEQQIVKGNRGKDPQPDRGNDGKGHQDNGKNPGRPSKPGYSHPSDFNCKSPLFDY